MEWSFNEYAATGKELFEKNAQLLRQGCQQTAANNYGRITKIHRKSLQGITNDSDIHLLEAYARQHARLNVVYTPFEEGGKIWCFSDKL